MLPERFEWGKSSKTILGTCLILFPIILGSVGTLGMVIPGQQSPSPGIPWALNFPSFESENFKLKKFLGEARDSHGFLGSCSGSSIILGKHIFMDEAASGSTKEFS